MHFLNDKWESYPVIIKVFETLNTFRCVLAFQMNNVFLKYELNVCVLAYVKDERNNLSTMNYALICFVLFWDCYSIIDNFCTCLLGPCNVQVLSIWHK
jgi:hypothetical protein